MMVFKDQAGSGKCKVVRSNLRSEIVNSKTIPHEYNDSSCTRLLLLRSQTRRHFEQHEEDSTQANERPHFHGSPPDGDAKKATNNPFRSGCPPGWICKREYEGISWLRTRYAP